MAAREFMFNLQEYCQAKAISEDFNQRVRTTIGKENIEELEVEAREWAAIARKHRAELSKIIFDDAWKLMQEMAPTFKAMDPDFGYEDPSHKPN